MGKRDECRASFPDRHLWAGNFFGRPGVHVGPDSVMNQKVPLTIINVSNPAAFSGKGIIIILEYTDADAAVKVARKIARETGRAVTVRTEDMRVIAAIPAATPH